MSDWRISHLEYLTIGQGSNYRSRGSRSGLTSAALHLSRSISSLCHAVTRNASVFLLISMHLTSDDITHASLLVKSPHQRSSKDALRGRMWKMLFLAPIWSVSTLSAYSPGLHHIPLCALHTMCIAQMMTRPHLCVLTPIISRPTPASSLAFSLCHQDTKKKVKRIAKNTFIYIHFLPELAWFYKSFWRSLLDYLWESGWVMTRPHGRDW